VKLPHSQALAEDSGATTAFPIRKLVGALAWATRGTLPHLSINVSLLAQAQDQGLQHTWDVGMRVLQYLNGIQDHGLFYQYDSSRGLEVYVDVSFAQTPDCKSITGYAIFYGGCLVAWKTSKQKTVEKSTSGAEYVGLSLAASEVLFLKQVLRSFGDLDVANGLVPMLFEDNKGAIFLAKKRDNTGRARHIDVHYHFVRERIELGELGVQHVGTKDQIADILTKPLYDLGSFLKFTKALGVYDWETIKDKFA
jgi:hypothetical protein